MADRLTDDTALALLINALATVAALGVLIAALGPVSGAHFNPAVTLVALAQRDLPAREGLGYVTVQILGGLVGVAAANLMFGLPAWEASSHTREGGAIWFGEVVATAGLLLVIGALTRTGRGHLGAVLVPAWIGAAYFFTSSTSFANPAVSIARSLTETFSGIAPASVPAFVGFELLGAGIGAVVVLLLFPRSSHPQPLDLPEPIHGQS